MPPQSNSCFNHYITIIFNCKGFFINIFWICVYVRFFGLILLLNLRYQLDVCVGANTVRPSKKQTHGNNKVRQQKILPDNSEFTANPEHGRTLFARRSNKPTATIRFGSKKNSPRQFWIYSKSWARANTVRPYRLFWRGSSAAKSLRSLRGYIWLGKG